MDWEHRRLLELAGIKRRRTPDHLLVEGDEDAGDDDLFADDDSGDDEGGDDLFGGDEDAGGDEGGDESGEQSAEGPGSNREPPEELDARDVEKFGSPRFLDLENKLQKMFNDAWASASAAAQNIEVYPGNAIDEEPPTPAKDDSPPEEDKDKDDAGEDKDEKSEDKNESFYRYGNSRDKWLMTEATRLLNEAEEEGAAADEFDMERFCTELANYLDNIHNTEDIEGAIFNSARQMVLNNFGKQTEGEFIDMLAAVTDNKWDFLGTHSDEYQVPLAVGASAAAAGA